jgi:hypothetical protein
MRHMVNILMILATLLMLTFLLALPNFEKTTLVGKGYIFPTLVVLSVGALHAMLRRFLIPLHTVPASDRETVRSIICSDKNKLFTFILCFGYLGLLSFAFLYMAGEIEKTGGEVQTCQLIYGSILFIAIGFAGNLRQVIHRLMLQCNGAIH